ncbi:hypothetical protein BV20DRAFT_125288 [Pilatotrama ljubarskyi]|nr:hypothetical protein BV20DRAFT_125288 [Pilatotrama ljubarskyi]
MDNHAEASSQSLEDVLAQLRRCQRQCARLKQQLNTASGPSRVAKKTPPSAAPPRRSEFSPQNQASQTSSPADPPRPSSSRARIASWGSAYFARSKQHPLARAKVLECLPGPVAGMTRAALLRWQISPAIFTRQSLNAILGGGTGTFARRTRSATDSARNYGIRDTEGYACLSTDFQPWLPQEPGQYGYMLHVRDQPGCTPESYSSEEYHHVFIGTGDLYRYYGRYRFEPVEPLSCVEWSRLDVQTRTAYADLARSADQHSRGTMRPRAATLKTYDRGTCRLQCLLLRCVGFQSDLYDKLLKEGKEL